VSNYLTAITTDESSREYLRGKIEYLLDLMDKEHKHASTHSQRNAYQAVIRIELEIMRDELRHTYSATDGINVVGESVPF
jgi:hypothetical protein